MSEEKNIAQEAIEIVNGARRNHYGTPLDNHTRTAEFWSTYVENAMKKGYLSAEDVCYMMMLVKIARAMEKDKRDNGVDIVGYALNVEIIKQQKDEKW